MDFVFRCDVRWEVDHCNSGIFFRIEDLKNVVHTGFEVQVLSGKETGSHHFGSIYDLAPGCLADHDLTVCCEVLEHLEDPLEGLEALYRSRAPSLIVSVPREPLWRVMNMVRLRYWGALGNTPGHLNHWSARRFVDFAARRFHVEEVRQPLPWTFLKLRR